MRCEEIMKADVQSLGPDDPVEAAARIMRERGVGFVPICDQDGKAIGTLTDRDIVVRVCAERRGLDTRVGDVMTEAVVCCGPGDSLDTAETLMARQQKSRVMVCDPGLRRCTWPLLVKRTRTPGPAA